MDLDQYIRFLMALVFVVALIMIVAWVMRRVGMAGGTVRGRARQRRLSVVEALPIDAKRRLILVRRDDREHLILLSANGDLLVDSAPAEGFDTALAGTADTPAASAPAGSQPR
ncbi:flagellar biosynthetic protein FliO [Azospirillum sp. A1-3]|uniref:FliO/MopB family protein n=1 Tax=Azospirillum sp. A1-3 TaxID=185874 RepID=UPI002076F6A1|nr:flagellar biosynthetic protein FliO [Azospirillum sp. A1-3]MCM8733854.1 flagellar biosynthetic protein FliO [Azospirillum sp. A1-3]